MSSLTPKSEVLRTTFASAGVVLLFVAGHALDAHGMSWGVGILGVLGLLGIFIAV
jgi:hypothetical protein